MNEHAVDPEDYAPPEGSEERELFDIVHLGVEAKNFMESELAGYICRIAEEKTINAQNELSIVNPDDRKEIIRLQSVIAKFAHFTESLHDMVTAGDTAYQLYLHQNSNEE